MNIQFPQAMNPSLKFPSLKFVFLVAVTWTCALFFITRSSNNVTNHHQFLLPPASEPADHQDSSPLELSQNGTRRITILFRSKYYYRQWFSNNSGFSKCDPSLECRFTSNTGLFNISDAVVFHGRASDLYLSAKQAAALPRPSNQKWVMYTRESPSRTPSLDKLNGLINWTATYMRISDMRYAYYIMQPGVYRGGFNPKRNYLAGKNGTAAILVSNCAKWRLKWISKVKQYIDVKVYGRCGPHSCRDRYHCMSMLHKHKFYLAFENSFCLDYVTEKLYRNAFANEVVPVILSDVDVNDRSTIPPGSVINALDFPTVKELAEYMKKVGSNSTLYNEYFRWHSKYTIGSGGDWCKLCRKLITDRNSHKVYKDIGKWYSAKQRCKPYPVPK